MSTIIYFYSYDYMKGKNCVEGVIIERIMISEVLAHIDK